jgi:hypothetical protein
MSSDINDPVTVEIDSQLIREFAEQADQDAKENQDTTRGELAYNRFGRAYNRFGRAYNRFGRAYNRFGR